VPTRPAVRAAACVLGLALALGAGCATPSRPGPGHPSGLGEDAARETLRRFAAALEAGRFADAHALLSARWRTATTPGRLAVDFSGAGPAAREAATRVLEALVAGVSIAREGATARLPLGTQRAAVLVAEGEAWKVDALE
jgi:hypothetical protein